MKKTVISRWAQYVVGMLVLASGLTLSTKTGLGVSPVISIPFVIAELFSLNFGNVTLVMYCLFIIAQFIMKSGRSDRIMVILQFPLSLAFTQFINLFSALADIRSDSFAVNLVVLVIAIILTGVGAAMTLNCRLVPNPTDGIVQAIADCTGKKVGFIKNCLDAVCVVISLALCLIAEGRLVGIGIGTVLAAVGVGRVISLFNTLFREKMECAIGLGAAAAGK